jgi:hypothetical protein
MRIPLEIFPLTLRNQNECSNTDSTVWRFFAKVKILIFDQIFPASTTTTSSTTQPPFKRGVRGVRTTETKSLKISERFSTDYKYPKQNKNTSPE